MSRVHRAVTVLGADPILWSRMDTVDHVESFLEFPGHDRRSKLYQRGGKGGGEFPTFERLRKKYLSCFGISHP